MDGDTRGLGSRVTARLGHPPRRLFVVGGGAAALALLVDRGLRLDLPRPPAPAPTRRPAPDEALLLAAVSELSRLVEDETSVLAGPEAGGVVRRLRTVSRAQLRVLRGRLTNAGVPTTVIDAAVAAPAPNPSPGATTGASGTPTPATTSPTASPTTSAPTTGAAGPARSREQLAQRLDALGAGDWSALTHASADTRGLLAAAYGSRLAGAVTLGHAVDVLETPSPARPQVVARTQPLVYAFEVVAAQSTGAQRRAAEETLAALTRLEVAVSGSASTTPPGWALPFPVTTPEEARRLATETLADAVASGGTVAGNAPTAASLEDVARWSANVQALAIGWDVPLSPFPGAEA